MKFPPMYGIWQTDWRLCYTNYLLFTYKAIVANIMHVFSLLALSTNNQRWIIMINFLRTYENWNNLYAAFADFQFLFPTMKWNFKKISLEIQTSNKNFKDHLMRFIKQSHIVSVSDLSPLYFQNEGGWCIFN